MNKLLILGLIITIISCAGGKKSNKSSVHMMNATYASIIPGAGGGKGKTFTISIDVKQKDLTVDSLWIDNHAIALEAYQEKNKLSGALPKGTITLKGSYFEPEEVQLERDESSPSPKSPKSNPPMRYEGKGLIRFWDKETPVYLIIKEIKKTETVRYH